MPKNTMHILTSVLYLLLLLSSIAIQAQVAPPASISESKYVTIGITSQYIDSPASSFGHIFLIFHRTDVIEQNSPTVSYAANVAKEDNFFAMLYKGVAGKYQGVITIEPLFKKINEYKTKEQRDLYFYTLDLTKEEHAEIIKRLSRLLTQSYPYYFFNENCTSFAKQILIPVNVKSIFFEIPSQCISDTKLKFKSVLLLPSNANQASFSFRQADEDVKNAVKKTINEGAKSKIPPTSLGIVENYYTYQYNKNDSFSESLLNSKLTVGNSKKLEYVAFSTPVHKKFTRIGVTANSKNELYLNFRPLYRDEYDLSQISHEGRFNLFEITSKISPGFKLEKLTFIEIAQFPIFDSLLTRKSWDLQLGIYRENPANELALQVYAGSGYSFPLFNNNNIGFTIGPHLNISKPNTYFSIRPHLFSFLTFNPRTKLILKYVYQVKKGDNVYILSSQIIREIQQDMYLQLGVSSVKKSTSEKELNLTMSYNF